MANVTDRLNQLQQYMDYYRNGGDGTNPFAGHFGRPVSGSGGANTWSGGGMVSNPNEPNNSALDWAQAQLGKQQDQQNMEDQNAIFKGMYSGNGQSPFGAPPAYVQPNNQQQQPNPYSARAMQLNNNPYSGSGDGGAASNSLAQMFRNGNYKSGG